MDEQKSTEPEQEPARIDVSALARRFAEAIEHGGIQVGEMYETRLIPLWYCPFMFCGTPGDREKLPSDGKAVGRCAVKWLKEIARAVNAGELYPRDPDAWLVQDDPADITPDSLVSWAELDGWAWNAHGLCTGYWELAESDIRREPVKPARVPTDKKLLEVIAALLAGKPRSKWPSGKDLEKAAQSVGISISDDTCRDALSAAEDIMTHPTPNPPK
jgi:hypothetical protein